MPLRSKQSKKIKKVLSARDKFGSTREWLDSLLSLLPEGVRLEEDSLGLLVQELRGGYGWEYIKIGNEYNEHIYFWRTLSHRFLEKPILQAILADTLLLAGRKDEAISLFLKAFDRKPVLVYKFGGELYDYMKEGSSENWLQYRLIVIRAALDSDDEDYALEVYQELLEEFRDDEAALEKIHALPIRKPS